MKIIVQIKNNYGTDLVYPVCDQAKIFAEIAGKKTLSNLNINLIKKLGYQVEVAKQTL